MEQLTPGTVLVTGGASGLGAAVAAAVAAAGGTPVVIDVREAPGFDTEIVDVADTRAAEAAVDRAASRHGGLDAVVTAAGIDRPAPLTALPGAEWDKIVGVNLLGTAAVVRAALPYVQISPNARIITVASTLGLSVASDATAYCASKWGIVGFTRSLAAELKGQVGVTLLVPGGMDTAFFDGRDEQYKPPPDAKLASPADVARAVVFALTQPPGLEIRELVVTASEEEELAVSAVLGVNAVFHDPAAALVVDGEIVAAAEEERFTRRKHGKPPVPFATWEIPEQSARWCLAQAGLTPGDLDAVAYSYDPALAPEPCAPGGEPDITADEWEGLRTLYARRAPLFLRTSLPGLDPAVTRFVPHHLAHAASTALAAPFPDSAVLVCDGRGEARSHWAGLSRGGDLTELAAQPLPDSLGLLYEEATEHLGFRRSSDEYKVMALAAYGEPAWIGEFRELVYPTGDGGFRVRPVDWGSFVKRVEPGGQRAGQWTREHANLAATVQLRLEEVLLSLAEWLHDATGDSVLTMAGGVALNCVANSRILREGPFERMWVQPAAGDAGTALGGALHVAHALGDRCAPMTTPALGRGWSDAELQAWLTSAGVPYTRPADIAAAVAERLARDEVVAWFQGRSEYGPRALGHRSLLAHPGYARNLERLNDVKGREQFRPVAPMVLASRAPEVFASGPVPSPYMLFTHQVRPSWRDRLPAVTHTDGSARAQTVDPEQEPLVARMLARFERLTGLPAVVNTSLNTAGRPMVDDPRDALECFGSAPVDALALGPFLVSRPACYERS